MADVIFATVVDPLTLGELYVCTDEGGAGGSEIEDMKNVKDSTGVHLQGNSRNKLERISPKYLLKAGATLLAAGASCAAYFVDKVTPGTDNESHATMTVEAHKRTKGDYVDKSVS